MFEILEKQKDFFRSGKTLDIAFRVEYLKKLKQTIKDYEELIFDALFKDLGKSRTESYMWEIGLVQFLAVEKTQKKTLRKLLKKRKRVQH